MSSTPVEVPFLVVGAGPAGASLASFLGQNDLQGLVISEAPGTADSPRAHLMNPFALECLRDVGLEEDATHLSTTGESLTNMRWCSSLTGREYGRVRYWGGAAKHASNVATSSPCRYLDLPQSQLEPLLVKKATDLGFPVRFNSRLESVEETGDGVLCTIKDLVSKISYQVLAKYIFGADGGRSTVARSFGLDFHREPSQGTAVNVIFNADLSHILRGREAQIHWVVRPASDSKFGKVLAIRMVRPSTEWMLILTRFHQEAPLPDLETQSEELVTLIKDVIGDDTIDVKIVKIDHWIVRETVATNYSSGKRAFILGDAAHRHPPAHGLGSNTCIQDAYNLGWKVAYVSHGLAGPDLLASYSLERQPVGAALVKEANECLRWHNQVSQALGMGAASTQEAEKHLSELYEASQEGVQRRKTLHEALEQMRHEGEGLGIAMNQFYASDAIFLGDETESRELVRGDPYTTPQVSTFPGSRLPHAWVQEATHQKRVSTHDLAGSGSFVIFYGESGLDWEASAAQVSRETGIPIKARGIGLGLDYHDIYREWRNVSGVEEDGCVLVRPDRFVAWRAPKMVPDSSAKLLQVLNKVLSRRG